VLAVIWSDFVLSAAPARGFLQILCFFTSPLSRGGPECQTCFTQSFFVPADKNFGQKNNYGNFPECNFFLLLFYRKIDHKTSKSKIPDLTNETNKK
jgi:hypothetical protein